MKRVILAAASAASLLVAVGVVFLGYQSYLTLEYQLNASKTQLALLEKTVGQIQQGNSKNLEDLKATNKNLEQKIDKSKTDLESLTLPQNLLDKLMTRIAMVQCQDPDGNNERGGSATVGLIDSNATGITLTTNYHVTGKTTSFCIVRLPESPSYTKQGPPRLAIIGKYDANFPSVDVALLHLYDAQENFGKFPIPACESSQIKTGDRITLFGYPSFGGNTLTVTDGIISGVLQTKWGPKYKTSAKIDFGNSGGLAVDNKNKCVIGIPTWARFGGELGQTLGTGESLGQIQSIEMIKKSGQVY